MGGRRHQGRMWKTKNMMERLCQEKYEEKRTGTHMNATDQKKRQKYHRHLRPHINGERGGEVK